MICFLGSSFPPALPNKKLSVPVIQFLENFPSAHKAVDPILSPT